MHSLCTYLKCRPVTLRFKKYTKQFPDRLHSHKWLNVILLHGMLASHETFPIAFFTADLAKHLQSVLNCNIDCYLIDARNHGLSPHNDKFSLEALTCDLSNFIHSHSIQSPLLIGHSMGGKTACLYSLLTNNNTNSTNNINNNICGMVAIDAAPSKYYHHHEKLFNAMQAVDFSKVEHKSNIDAQLKKSGIECARDRAFILTNAIKTDANDVEMDDNIERLQGNELKQSNLWKWRCNLDVIAKHESEIHTFPTEAELDRMNIYSKPSMFIGGSLSSRLTSEIYVKDVNYWFPNNEIVLLEGGEHFVHRTHTKQSIKNIGDYCKRLNS